MCGHAGPRVGRVGACPCSTPWGPYSGLVNRRRGGPGVYESAIQTGPCTYPLYQPGAGPGLGRRDLDELGRLAEALTAEGLVPPQGGATWHWRTVYTVVKHEGFTSPRRWHRKRRPRRA